MNRRCGDAGDKSYHNYGGRGITVCDRWRESFENFLADMGRRPSPQHSIDRINNDGNYEPGNCRWATNREQSLNRRNNRQIELDGVRMPLDAWREETGLTRNAIRQRIDKLGWDTRRALTQPVRAMRSRRDRTG